MQYKTTVWIVYMHNLVLGTLHIVLAIGTTLQLLM